MPDITSTVATLNYQRLQFPLRFYERIELANLCAREYSAACIAPLGILPAEAVLHKNLHSLLAWCKMKIQSSMR